MSRKPVILSIAALLSILSSVGLAATGEAKRPVAGPLPAAPARLRTNEAACKQAVQAFYDWYLPRLVREVRTPAMAQALHARSGNFGAPLRRELAEDLDASKKNPDEIVGLDFDPFTNSQDPAPRYVVRKATRTPRGYRMAVHGVIEGKVSEEPDVIPELVLSQGHWRFVNFHYPAQDDGPKTDLLTVLKELRHSRRNPAPRGSRR